MSGDSLRGVFLHKLPPSVLVEFCRLMDGLSDLDWTRFASAVLKDQNDVRLCERMMRRTDWVMNQWGNRNGRVGELLDLLDALQLFKQRDVILACERPLTPQQPPVPYVCLNLSSAGVTEVTPPPPLPPPPQYKSVPAFKPAEAPPTADVCPAALPGPAPPPRTLLSKVQPQEVLRSDVVPPPSSLPPCSTSAVMCWPYEEVHAGTRGFSPALQVGEGGFGVVYRACLKNVDCAVKRLRQDGVMDWTQLRRSFQTEVEKLSKFRHPNIVDLLGFSEGGGSMCLIYSFMENRSLEDQLHGGGVLTWSQRVSVVAGAAAALQFLHFLPLGEEPLIHGDVKSSNILLDRHMEAKLSDFGLARYAPPSLPSCSATHTASVGRTATVRGTLAYLPDEYVRKGELCTAVDVYSFGVVLLEVLTGRKALEKDRKTGDIYLKDLVVEVEEEDPDGPGEAAWRRRLDRRLVTGGAAEPAGFQEVVALACQCLNRQRKRRPPMTEVFDCLRRVHNMLRKAASSSSPQPDPRLRPPCSPDHVDVLSQQLSRLGPLEHSYPPSQSSSSSSSSSFSPHPLQSSSLPHLSSITGPCETDESRGFSQYDLHPRSRCDCSSNPGPPSSHESPSQSSSTGDCPRSSSRTSSRTSSEPDSRLAPAGLEAFSPVRSLQAPPLGPSNRPGAQEWEAESECSSASVLMNSSKRRLLEKTQQYKEGQIRTAELLSSQNLYTTSGSADPGEPEESDELDYLQHS
ncbi:interleukin-1 receptor-associated kinase 1 isoform X2 [Oryzias melastigma]|uniref:interleukin-1 receptor-associated kinase 1 isoform X2 n=1 Tax=Oryzias melastigma TaxID=30732 RepID=UPI000CF7F8AF|nr:interleukin-1 receptor-associated kinase 1 isoform X2 [Oryzias melastigma]